MQLRYANGPDRGRGQRQGALQGDRAGARPSSLTIPRRGDAVRRLDTLTPYDRDRLVARLADLDRIDALMVERGTLAGVADG